MDDNDNENIFIPDDFLTQESNPLFINDAVYENFQQSMPDYSTGMLEFDTNPVYPLINMDNQDEQEIFNTLINLSRNDLSHQNVDLEPTNNTRTDRIYELEIVQQPLRGRMCGFGDRDRRPVTPPPILKLTIKSKDGEVIHPDSLNTSFLVVMCDLNPISISQTTEEIIQFSINESMKMKNLVGSLITSATKLYDPDGELGIYFIFQDLCLRLDGLYKLKFILIDLESPNSNNLNTSSISTVLKIVESDEFYVYTAKQFPGVAETTPLSICFARQGIKMPIRKISKKPSTCQKDSEPDQNTT